MESTNLNKTDNLINWGELSRQLAGSRSVVTKNRMPKKHEKKVNELRAKITEWLETLPIQRVINCPLCGGEMAFIHPENCTTDDCPNCVF